MTDLSETRDTPGPMADFTALVLTAAKPQNVVVCHDPEALASLLSARDSLALLVYAVPAEALAGPIGTGTEVAVALAEWSDRAARWLAAQARLRGRVLLAEAPGDEAARQALSEALSAFLGETRPAPDAAAIAAALTAAAPGKDPATEPFGRVEEGAEKGSEDGPEQVHSAAPAALTALAAVALRQDRTASDLADRLEAGTLGDSSLETDSLAALERLAGALGGMRLEHQACVADLEAVDLAWEDAEARADGLAEALDAAREALIERSGAEAEQAHALAQERRAGAALQARLEAEAQQAEAAAARQRATWQTHETALQAEIARLQVASDAVAPLRDRIAALEEAVRQAETETTRTAAELTVARARLEETDETLRDLRGAEAEAAFAAAGLRQTLSEREAALAELTALAGVAERAASRVPGLETELAWLTATRNAAGAEAEASALALDTLITQIGALEQGLVRSQSARAEAVTERGRLDAFWRGRTARLEAMLDAVHRSTSWRLTKPARAMVRSLRRSR